MNRLCGYDINKRKVTLQAEVTPRKRVDGDGALSARRAGAIPSFVHLQCLVKSILPLLPTRRCVAAATYYLAEECCIHRIPSGHSRCNRISTDDTLRLTRSGYLGGKRP